MIALKCRKARSSRRPGSEVVAKGTDCLTAEEVCTVVINYQAITTERYDPDYCAIAANGTGRFDEGGGGDERPIDRRRPRCYVPSGDTTRRKPQRLVQVVISKE